MTPTENDAEIARLAALDPVAYDREREDAAKRLGVRVGTLDAELHRRRQRTPSVAKHAGASGILIDVEPWPEAVSGSILLDEITSTVRRHVSLRQHLAETTVLWSVLAHCHDAAEHSPILALQSAVKRCGKTNLLAIVAELVPRSLPTANITPAALFRAVEMWHPTLLIDEGDTFLKDNEDMRGILNSGLTRASAFCIRCDGEDNTPRAFSTWCPKLIALIGRLPETLQDRAIIVTLQRRLEHEQVVRFDRRHHPAVHKLRRKAARFALDNTPQLAGADPSMPPGLHDRARDCWRPMLAIADIAGGHWSETARRAAIAVSGGGGDEADASAGVMLLSHVREVMTSKGACSIRSSELVIDLCANEEWPWGEWRGGKPISTRGVAFQLKPFGIRSKHAAAGNRYHAEDFADAWARYLPSIPPAASFTSFSDGKNSIKHNRLCDDDTRSASFSNGMGLKLVRRRANAIKSLKSFRNGKKLKLVKLEKGGAGERDVRGLLEGEIEVEL